jgi:GH15 family glucan-1,4-alpha-glucosidase
MQFEQYNTTTFNSFLYIAALRAGTYLAGLFNDTDTATLTTAAASRAEAAMDALLWNSTYNYWRAYTGGSSLR